MEGQNTPAPQKVFWKTSQRDTDNIDVDEIKALPDLNPFVPSDEEEKSSLKPSISSSKRLRSGSASRRLVIGSKPPLKSPMKVEANRKFYFLKIYFESQTK